MGLVYGKPYLNVKGLALGSDGVRIGKPYLYVQELGLGAGVGIW